MGKRKEQFPLLWDSSDRLHTDKVLEFNIDRAIDENAAVRASASRELQSIRRSIAEKYDHLRKSLESILRNVSDLGFSQEEIITTREGRMVIPVKVEHKNRVPGFIHSASASGATVFIEPTETLELNNDIRGLHFQEQREVERILKALTQQIAETRDPLTTNLDILASLDALQAKARYSIEVLGVEPAITVDGPVRLVQARHPVLMIHHGLEGTVPLDLKLGEGYNCLVISGPNAGGKSVAMKCVGLLCMMVQAGLHIPAGEGSALRVFQKVFVDIGDDQSIESDLSTFSSHLQNLKAIAERADAQSLVLIDEIGSGTDPAEGGAIAAAVLEHLTRRGAFTIATTHQGALKVFAHETEGVENGAMEFDLETLEPTYRFTTGIPGSSYALEMAGRLGFDDGLMRRAHDFLGHRQTRLETLLTELESSAQQSRRHLEELTKEKLRLDSLVREYEEKVSSLKVEVRTVKRTALEEARAIVERANAAIERSVREIREQNADRDTVRRVREEIDELKERIASMHAEVSEEPPPEPETALSVGSRVTIRQGTDVGEITSLSADGKTAVVVLGSVKVRVPLSDLRGAGGRAVSSTAGAAENTRELPLEVHREVDLRGMTGDEALPLLDKFIDTATLAGLHRIDIIHGKGTGALRKRVSEFLAHDPRVQSFRLGEWNEGSTGATVVELKDA
jgi:DNA mismatch repair protein MutS2